MRIGVIKEIEFRMKKKFRKKVVLKENLKCPYIVFV